MASAEGGSPGNKLVSHARDSGVTLHYMSEGDLRSAFQSAPWLKREGCENPSQGGEEEPRRASNLDRTPCEGGEGREDATATGEAAKEEQPDASHVPKQHGGASEDKSLPVSEQLSSEGGMKGLEHEIVASQKVEIEALKEEVQLLQGWQNEAIEALEEEVRMLRGGQNQGTEAPKEQLTLLQQAHEEQMASMKAELEEVRTAHCMVLAKSAAIAEVRAAEIAALGEEAGRAGEAADNLRGELEEARECVRAKGEEIHRLELTILSKDEEMRSVKEDALSSKRDLERELEDNVRMRLDQESERDMLLGERAALKGKCDYLEEERKRRDAEVRRLEEETRKLKEVGDIIKDAELKRLNDEAKKLKEGHDAAVKELRNTNSILEQKRKRVLVDYIALKGHCDGLENEVDEKSKMVHTLQAQARKFNEEVRTMMKELRDANKSLKEQHEGATAEHSELKRKYDNLEAETRDKEEEVRALKEERQKMKEEGAVVSNELSIAAMHSQMTEENSSLKEKCDRLEGEIKSKEDESRALKEEARRLKKTDAARCKELKAKSEEMRALKEEAQRLREGDAARFKELQERERKLMAGIDSSMRELRDEYEEKLDDMSKTLKSHQLDMLSHMEKSASKDTAIEELRRGNDGLSSRIEEQSEVNVVLRAQLKATQLDKEAIVKRHSGETLTHESKIFSMKGEIESKIEIINGLERNNKFLCTQVKERGDSNEALKMQLKKSEEGLTLKAEEIDSMNREIKSKNVVIEGLKTNNEGLHRKLEEQGNAHVALREEMIKLHGKDRLARDAEINSMTKEIDSKDAVLESLRRDKERLRRQLEGRGNADGTWQDWAKTARPGREEAFEPPGREVSAQGAEIDAAVGEIEERIEIRPRPGVGSAPPGPQRKFAFLRAVSNSFEMPARLDHSIETIDDKKDGRDNAFSVGNIATAKWDGSPQVATEVIDNGKDEGSNIVSGENIAAAEQDKPTRAATAVTPTKSERPPLEKAVSKEAFRSIDGDTHFGTAQKENAEYPSSHTSNRTAGNDAEANCGKMEKASEPIPQSDCSHESENHLDKQRTLPTPQIACDRMADAIPMHQENNADDSSQSQSTKTGELAADGSLGQERSEESLGVAASLSDSFGNSSPHEIDGDRGMTVKGMVLCANQKKPTGVPACTSSVPKSKFAPPKTANALGNSRRSQVGQLDIVPRVACNPRKDGAPMHQKDDADDLACGPSACTEKLSNGGLLAQESDKEFLGGAASMDNSIKKLSTNEKDGVHGMAAKGAAVCADQKKELHASPENENTFSDSVENQVDTASQVAFDRKTDHSPNGILSQESIKESFGAAASSIKKSFANESVGTRGTTDIGTATRDHTELPGNGMASTSTATDGELAPSNNASAFVGSSKSRAVHLDAGELAESNTQSDHFCTRRKNSAELWASPPHQVALNPTTDTTMNQKDNARGLAHKTADGVSARENVETSLPLKTINMCQSPRMAAPMDLSIEASSANEGGGNSDVAAETSANSDRRTQPNDGSNDKLFSSIIMNLFGGGGKSDSGNHGTAAKGGPMENVDALSQNKPLPNIAKGVKSGDGHVSTQDGSNNSTPGSKLSEMVVETPKLQPMEKEDAPSRNKTLSTIKYAKSETSDEKALRQDGLNNPADKMIEKTGRSNISLTERAPAAQFGPGWTEGIVKRKSGRKDRYFVSPEGKRFRSPQEVQRYMESKSMAKLATSDDTALLQANSGAVTNMPNRTKTSKCAKSASSDVTAFTQGGLNNPIQDRPMENADALSQNKPLLNVAKYVKSATSDGNALAADTMNSKIRPTEKATAAQFGPGWTVKIVTGKNGRKNRYFVSPEGKRFRSPAEVQRYMKSNSTQGKVSLNSMEETPRNSSSAESIFGRGSHFDWDWCIEALEEYRQVHGNYNVTHKSGPKKLAQFVKKMREYKRNVDKGLYKGTLLTPDRIRQLSDMGFQWVSTAGKRTEIDTRPGNLSPNEDKGTGDKREGSPRPARSLASSKDDVEIGSGSDRISRVMSIGGTVPRVIPGGVAPQLPPKKRKTMVCDLEYVNQTDRGTSMPSAFGIQGEFVSPKPIQSGQRSRGEKRGSAGVSFPGEFALQRPGEGHAAAWPRTKHARKVLAKRTGIMEEVTKRISENETLEDPRAAKRAKIDPSSKCKTQISPARSDKTSGQGAVIKICPTGTAAASFKKHLDACVLDKRQTKNTKATKTNANNQEGASLVQTGPRKRILSWKVAEGKETLVRRKPAANNRETVKYHCSNFVSNSKKTAAASINNHVRRCDPENAMKPKNSKVKVLQKSSEKGKPGKLRKLKAQHAASVQMTKNASKAVATELKTSEAEEYEVESASWHLMSKEEFVGQMKNTPKNENSTEQKALMKKISLSETNILTKPAPPKSPPAESTASAELHDDDLILSLKNPRYKKVMYESFHVLGKRIGGEENERLNQMKNFLFHSFKDKMGKDGRFLKSDPRMNETWVVDDSDALEKIMMDLKRRNESFKHWFKE